MDEAYKQHSHQARRKNRSSTNLNHLTLAPLTTKLPLDEEAYTTRDSDYTQTPPPHTTSYIQGKSAPTTPGLLSRSPAHPHGHGHSNSSSAAYYTSSRRRSSVPSAQLPKSKSASHLAAADQISHGGRNALSGTSSPTHARGRSYGHGNHGTTNQDINDADGDWFMRAGVLMSSEAREFKGQAWLASRASTTSLAGIRDAEEEAFEREFARERELAASQESRRGSMGDLATAGDYGGTHHFGQHQNRHRSARGSRVGSRSGSRVSGVRSQLLTPLEGSGGRRSSEEGYFSRGAQVPDGEREGQDEPEDGYIQGPDFVNLDEKLEAIDQDTSLEDEAAVRKLVRGERSGRGSWFGWALFSVEEDDQSDGDDVALDVGTGEEESVPQRKSSSVRHFEGVTNEPKEHISPPDPDQGGWGDAAWLLSVASKVML